MRDKWCMAVVGLKVSCGVVVVRKSLRAESQNFLATHHSTLSPHTDVLRIRHTTTATSAVDAAPLKLRRQILIEGHPVVFPCSSYVINPVTSLSFKCPSCIGPPIQRLGSSAHDPN